MPYKPTEAVFIVMPSLGAGGAERVLVSLANTLARDTSVFVCAIRRRGALLADLDPQVRVIRLLGRMLWPLALIHLVWSYRPRAVLSSAWDVNLVLMLLGPLLPGRTRLVVREPCAPHHVPLERPWVRHLLPMYYRLYSRVDVVVALSQHMAKSIERQSPAVSNRIRVIYNVPPPNRLTGEAAASGADHDGAMLHFVAMGRLVPEKGFDVLIHAFMRFLDLGFRARLTIYGEGRCRQGLQALIAGSGASPWISLPGFLPELAALKNADVFVLSSRYEGLSNAMVEALLLGLPVVAVGGETSAQEFIRPGENGVLVPACSVAELTEGLRLYTEQRRQFNRDTIARDARRTFSYEEHVQSYSEVLLSHQSSSGNHGTSMYHDIVREDKHDTGGQDVH